MKKILTLMALFIFASPAICQYHYVGKGDLKIGLKVNVEDGHIPIGQLCDGFDTEMGAPINLVIPAGSSLAFSYDSLRLTDITLVIDSEEPEYITGPVGNNNKSSGLFGSTSSGPGSSRSFQIIDEVNNDTLTIEWTVGYDKVKLQDIFPGEYFPNYVSMSWSFLFSSYPDTSQYDWNQYSFIDSVDSKGLPVGPKFPYDFNSIFFLPTNLEEEAKIKLVGLHDDFQNFQENEPFGLFLYEDLKPGQYTYMIKPYADAPRELWLEYPFTILKPWWWQTPFLIAESVLLTIALAGFVFLLYRRNTKKKEKQLLLQQQLTEAELKAIRAQLNPHFLFNALSSIQNLVAQQQSEKAQTYLNKLSKLLREVLTVSERQFHELEQELKLTELYLELEMLRYPFKVEFHKTEDFDGQVLVPVMLLQPFVENAVKHGMAGQENGKIDIFIKQKGSQLVFSIEDNGPGLPGNWKDSDGLRLSKERVKYLKSIYENDVELSIENREGTSGTIVTIKLPTE